MNCCNRVFCGGLIQPVPTAKLESKDGGRDIVHFINTYLLTIANEVLLERYILSNGVTVNI